MMRRSYFLSVILLIVFGCAPTTVGSRESAIEIAIEQFPPSEFQARQGRAISIAYQATVRNRSSETVTLRKIEMQTIRTSPYVLRDEAVDLNKTIEASKEKLIAFEMWAYPREGASASDDRVWLRGVAHFESASGTFTKSFNQSFREPKPVE